MAIPHCAVRVHSRSKGHSTAGAVAYRAGLDLTDERTGEEKRFGRRSTRGDVLGSGIVGGDFAAGDFGGWAAAIEAAEKRTNSRILRDIQVSLPAELKISQQEKLLRRIAADLAARYNTTCTWHHHRADRRGDKRNRHGHILMATRRLADGGGFGAKLRQLDSVEDGPKEIKAIRQIFEKRTNEALKAAGLPDRITALRDPAVEPDRPPQPTLGRVATSIERRAAAERRGQSVLGESIAQTVRDGAATGPGHRLADHTSATTLNRLSPPVRAAALDRTNGPPRPETPRPPHDLAALRGEAARREERRQREEEIARTEQSLERLPARVRAAALTHADEPPLPEMPRPPHDLAALQGEAARREERRQREEEIARTEQSLERLPAAIRADALTHADEPPLPEMPRPPHDLAALRGEANQREERRQREEEIARIEAARREERRQREEEIARIDQRLERLPAAIRADALDHANEPPLPKPPRRPTHDLAALQSEDDQREAEYQESERAAAEQAAEQAAERRAAARKAAAEEKERDQAAAVKTAARKAAADREERKQAAAAKAAAKAAERRTAADREEREQAAAAQRRFHKAAAAESDELNRATAKIASELPRGQSWDDVIAEHNTRIATDVDGRYDDEQREGLPVGQTRLDLEASMVSHASAYAPSGRKRGGVTTVVAAVVDRIQAFVDTAIDRIIDIALPGRVSVVEESGPPPVEHRPPPAEHRPPPPREDPAPPASAAGPPREPAPSPYDNDLNPVQGVGRPAGGVDPKDLDLTPGQAQDHSDDTGPGR